MEDQGGPHRLGVGLPAARRSLDIGEQKRHGSRRRAPHGARSYAQAVALIGLGVDLTSPPAVGSAQALAMAASISSRAKRTRSCLLYERPRVEQGGVFVAERVGQEGGGVRDHVLGVGCDAVESGEAAQYDGR